MDASYPKRHETTMVTDDGERVFIRPIKPEDAARLTAFFHDLSPCSVLFRFLSPIRSLSPELVARFTRIDTKRDVALVAVRDGDDNEHLIAVARIMRQTGSREAEFAVVVTDAWQGKGVGARLLELCLNAAVELEIEEVWGIVLRENTQMIALGRKLGFGVRRIPDTDTFELRLRLCSLKKKG